MRTGSRKGRKKDEKGRKHVFKLLNYVLYISLYGTVIMSITILKSSQFMCHKLRHVLRFTKKVVEFVRLYLDVEGSELTEACVFGK